MKPSRGFFLLALAVVAGCAVLAGSPPAPPVALSIPGAPTEYRLTPIKWNPGLTLTYNTQKFTEEKMGGERNADQTRGTFRMRGIERTVKGGVRVGVTADSTDLGFFIVDEAGGITDAVTANPKDEEGFRILIQWMQISQQNSRALRLGESFRIDLPVPKESSLFPLGRPAFLQENMSLDCQFLGYVKLSERLAVGIRCEMENMLQKPGSEGRQGSRTALRVDSIGGYEIEYRDPAGGFPIARYLEVTAKGQVGDQPFVYRTITLTELDRTRSSGF